MAKILANLQVNEHVTVISLSCGHKHAMERSAINWPLGKEVECKSCANPDSKVVSVRPSTTTPGQFLIFFDCQHFTMLKPHHGLDSAGLVRLEGTQQYCADCHKQTGVEP